MYVPFRRCCMDKDRCTCSGVSLDPLCSDVRLGERCVQQHHNLQLTKSTSEIDVLCSMLGKAGISVMLLTFCFLRLQDSLAAVSFLRGGVAFAGDSSPCLGSTLPLFCRKARSVLIQQLHRGRAD